MAFHFSITQKNFFKIFLKKFADKEKSITFASVLRHKNTCNDKGCQGAIRLEKMNLQVFACIVL